MSNGTTPDTGEPGTPAVPWYADGLQFECLWPECKACCGGEPGFVWITMDEAQALADHVGETLEDFLAGYCREVGTRMSLIEVGGDAHRCVFLGETGCNVYGARPAQCQSYPFWPEVLKSAQSWDDEARWCPGINRGRAWTRDEIDGKASIKPHRRPFWYDKRVVDEVRRQLLDSIRDNVALKRAERGGFDEDDDDIPWTDPEDDPDAPA